MDPIEEAYNRKKTTPLYWYNRSSDLRASAAALDFSRAEMHCQSITNQYNFGSGFSMSVAVTPVYCMLWGMSFELLFKGIAVATRKEFPPTHNLVRLASVVHLSFTGHELGILNYLSQSIVWDGRYPVPLESKSKGRKHPVETMKEVYQLQLDHLSEEVPLGTLTARTYNGALDWHSLDALWRPATNLFFEKEATWQEIPNK